MLSGFHAQQLQLVQNNYQIIENTYNHVFQGTFGKPAVKKYWDEYVSQWFPEDLKKDD